MFPARLLVVVVAVAFLVAFVQLGVLQLAFHKLGLSADSAALLLMVTLFGSLLNLPLFTVRTDPAEQERRLRDIPPALLARIKVIPGRTVIAVNVGGCVVPLAFSLYLFNLSRPDVLHAVTAVATVAMVSYGISFSIPRVGIAMPVLVAPLTAAAAALMLDPEQAPALAYIGGTLGVLIGADILRLKDIGKLGEPMASIGGAGSFDGIFVTGIVAVLLA
ncbi:MAG: DUF1614 domain-containing protein [Rhodocyclaceae bacterium]|nr:DUF1614 domain-containing protein [Rhodocyclaceae bacterium]GIK26681.1 MAG: hypothetical protein BroJett006_29270 [Betaproteobacteria bacterium]